MSDVSGGVYSTASAAIVCVTVLLEDNRKSETFFNDSRQRKHFPPSLSGMLTLRTLIIPSLPVVHTLTYFSLRVFRGPRL